MSEKISKWYTLDTEKHRTLVHLLEITTAAIVQNGWAPEHAQPRTEILTSANTMWNRRNFKQC